MKLPADTVERLLLRWPVARLATARSDGTPHMVPVVFARVGTHLWSPIDGKPKPDREPRRLQHLRRTGQATLLLDRYADDWSALWWIRIDATAAVLTAEDPRDDPGMQAAVDALRTKYPQYAHVPLFHGTPTLIRFTPRVVRTWCAGPAALAGIA